MEISLCRHCQTSEKFCLFCNVPFIVSRYIQRDTYMLRAHLSFLLVLLTYLGSSPAYSEDCFYGNCNDGFSIKKRSNGIIFLGEYKDGLLTGPGRFIDKDGDQCTGNWLKGRMSGETFCRYTNGAVFIGNFVKGKKSGGGIHFNGDGTVLREGIFENGRLSLAIATSYSDNINLLTDTLNTKFNDCLVGDCTEGWGIKLAFGGVLQEQQWNSRKSNDIDNTSSLQITPTLTLDDLSPKTSTAPSAKFLLKLAKLYPSSLETLENEQFKQFVKSTKNVGIVLQEAFKQQDTAAIGALLEMYQDDLASISTEAQSHSFLKNQTDSSIASVAPKKVSPKLMSSEDESEAGIPVQYRNNGRQEHDEVGLWVFIALSIPLIGWGLRIYFFEMKDSKG